AYCIQNEAFLSITQIPSAQISTVDGAKSYSLTNHNSLLQMMDGALSGKTGFTARAGYCYVGAYRSGNHTYTFALLACGWPSHRDYKWSDARQLIAYAEENYSDRILAEGQTAVTIPVSDAVTVSNHRIMHPETIAAHTTGETIIAFLSDTDEVDIRYDLPESVAAPVEAGTAVGSEKLYLNGVLYAEREITLSESVARYDLRWCLDRVIRMFLL
ncbi:MAG: D-alanyl-D-alanine carboxypeptidase, partial [Lachnospiraceae bacterium]|nr:D-alanyl-D-alanine carboxypeptidase [Lachnospiraceae bacterium]